MMASLVLAGCASAPAVKQVNSLGMSMVLVPAGEFTMGNELPAAHMARLFPGHEAQRLSDLKDEAPAHHVRITRAFYMGQYEVTVGQFRRFLQASGHVPESVADATGGYGYNASYVASLGATGDAFEGRDPRYSWQNPGFKQTDDHPVVNVSWNDAVAMATWLSQQEGRRYRLPTEAEWEYACRGGTPTQFNSGDAPSSLKDSANVFDQDAAGNWPKWQAFATSARDGYPFTAPVGQFKANAFGLHDMHGNVWEWVSDWYDDQYYAKSPVNDPQGPADGNVKVRRGGSWHTWPLYARSAYRNWNSTSTRYTLVGFRLVMEAP